MAARKPKREAITVAAASGDRRRALVALRDQLAAAIEMAEPKELAPLARQFSAVVTELAALPEAKESNPVDDLAARRSARRSTASG